MTIKFVLASSSKKVFATIEGLDKSFKRGIRRGMSNSGIGLVKSANAEILRKPKSGRLYIVKTRSGRWRRHIASAPFETHANLTGDTRRSLSFKLHGISQLEFGYGVSAGKKATEYAEGLEFGTETIKPRPSLQNALRDQQGHIVQHFENAISKQLK